MKNNELKLIRELEKEVSNYYEKAQAFIDSNSKNYRGVFYKKSIDKYGITLDGVKGVVRHTAVTCPNKANTLLFATAWAMLAQEVYNLDKKEGKPTYLAWARHYGYLNSASTTVAKTTSKNIDKPKQTSHSKVRRINTLNGYSWEEVYKICKRGDACRYFKKGDKATILLNTMKSMSNDKATYGKVKTLPSQFATVTVMGIGYFTLYLFISAYEEEIPKYKMASEVNSYLQSCSTIGGWCDTPLRHWLNEEGDGGFYHALPDDLKKAISLNCTPFSRSKGDTEVYHCPDNLWLLGLKEIFGKDDVEEGLKNFSNDIPKEVKDGKQFEYFEDADNIDSFANNVENNFSWLRSCIGNSYCYGVSSKDSLKRKWSEYKADAVGNVFPAFCIGSSDFEYPNLYEGDADVLNKYSYNEIKDICQKNEAEKRFKVGDKLLISLGELTLEKETIPQQTALAKISNISANGNWIEMNIIGYSKKAPIMKIDGGSCSSWKSTTLREWLNEKFLNALPNELKDILVTRYHTSQGDICDEMVWLPREMEVFDNKMQSDYFKTNKLRYSGNSICSWWLQTLASSSAKYGHTYHTDSKNSQFFASAINQKVEEFACRPLGVFPSFCIGKKSDRYKKDATSQINTINGYTFKEIQEFCDNDEVWKHFQPGDSGFIKLKPITGLTVRGRCLEYENTPSQVAEVTILRTDFNNMDLMITNYEFKAPRYYMDGYRHNKTYDNAILEGWGGSNMREWLNKNFIEALPPELVSLLYSRNNTYATFHLQYSYNIHSRESEPFFWHYGKPSDVTGTSDKVWLLSEGDISDKNNKSYASWENQYAYDRQDQLPFFKEGGTTKMYENNKAVEYWLRNLAETSDNPEFGSKSSYGIVTESGNLYYNRADVLKAVFPCFSIKHYHSYPSYKYNSSFSCPF